MAINKNFVIKNGVQVNTNLIVGDSTLNKVGVGTTTPGYTLHVGGTRGGIGATDLNITGVGTITNLNVLGVSTFAGDASVAGIVSAQSFGIGTTEVIDRGMRLSGIASLDAVTTATIESAIKSGPNIFDDLKVLGISTFVGVTTFLGGIDVNVRSGVSTFSAPVQFGIAPIDGQAGLSSNFVAVGATVGFGTTAFFRDNAAIFMGDGSDLKIHHDGSNSYIQDVGTGDLIVRGSADIKLQSASSENYLVANDTGSVDIYFDNSKKVETTSGGLKVTGITTLTDRLHVQAGVSTFDADVRYGIGATVGFGTTAFFRDDAAIYLGNDLDTKLYHAAGGDTIFRHAKTGAGNDLNIETATALYIGKIDLSETMASFQTDGAVKLFFDGSQKLETTSGGLNVSGITTFSNRIYVTSGISTFNNNAKLVFGDQGDLTLYHDNSNSIISNATGELLIDSDTLNLRSTTGSESFVYGSVGAGVTLFYDNASVFQTTPQGINVSGVTTTARLYVSGISTFLDNAKINIGTGNDLSLWHDATNSYISNNTGELRIDSKTGERAVVGIADSGVHIFFNNAKKLETISTGASVTGDMYISGNLYVSEDISYDEITGRNLNITGITTLADQVNFGTSGVGATVYSNGNVTISGIATVASDLVVLGNLDVTGDISYDEVTGRNINISGVTTLGSGAGGGVMVTPVGAGATIGNANGAGIVTYYGDGAYLTNIKAGVGIGSTTGLVGYGFTYIHFNGPGVSTVYADARPDFVGYATVFIQGGGGSSTVGAAGTWTPEGSIGISTSKSVGINTVALNDPDVQGIGNSFQGLYIGNGMLMVDNALNGDHYIGTNFNGLMGGPVTINGVLTVDGNWVVV